MNNRDINSRRDPLVVVFCADDNCAKLLAVSLQSMLNHSQQKKHIHLYILDGGISDLNKKKINRIADVEHIAIRLYWIKPDITRLSGVKPDNGSIKATYLRLLIPDVLPQDCQKAIYLDSDILIRTDLSLLWNEQIGDNILLAVRDPVNNLISSRGGVIEYMALGLSADAPYFNSGVMVLNLSKWRENDICNQALRYARKYWRSIQYNDQGALNAIVAGKFGKLDPRWNVVSPIFFGERCETSPYLEKIMSMQEELLENAYIYHFTGPKPEDERCEHPARVMWHRYLRDSKWKDPIKQKNKSGSKNCIVDATSQTEKTSVTYDPISERAEMLRKYNQLRDWINKEEQAKKDIAMIIPEGESFILVDDGNFGEKIAKSRKVIPFTEYGGKYWGPPQNDAAAVNEIIRLYNSGAKYLVFTWPAFWWLEYYTELSQYILSRFNYIAQNERIIAFDLRNDD